MEYIDYKEFLKQSEKVQETLKKWWKAEDLEPYYDTEYKFTTVVVKHPDASFKFHKDKCIPLFTEGQLRKFIIDKGYKYIGINNFLECKCKGNQYNIKVFKSMMQLENNIEFYCNTSLECFWKVACKIA